MSTRHPNAYQVLRDELDYRLHLAETDGVPVEVAMADLIRLALTLAVAVHGPVETEARISEHLAQMRRSFPAMYGTDSFPPVAGNA